MAETGRYVVAADAVPPDLTVLPGIAGVAEPFDEHHIDVHFDTATLRLAVRGMGIRRRTGGVNAGWRIDGLPAAAAHADDVVPPDVVPLGREDEVPPPIADRVRAITRGESLVRVARTTEHRTVRRLYGHSGEHVADFIDSSVTGESYAQEPPCAPRRTWAVVPARHGAREPRGASGLLATVGAPLTEATSDVERALGNAYPRRTPATERRGGRNLRVWHVVEAYVAAQTTELMDADAGVRCDDPDAVHRMRSAIRRIRSVLGVYGRVLRRPARAALSAELKWLAGALGGARDAQVLRDRLLGPHSSRDEAADRGLRRLAARLDQDHAEGYRRTLKAIDSERYFALLDTLDNVAILRRRKGLGGKAAAAAMPKLVDRDAARFRASADSAARTGAGKRRDAALHRVRKNAKRLRHATEPATQVLGKPAKRLGRSARRIQRILGDHQDSVLARRFLAEIQVDAETGGAPRPTPTELRIYGELAAEEESAAKSARRRYRKALRKLRAQPPLA